jgi:hypothetical protein
MALGAISLSPVEPLRLLTQWRGKRVAGFVGTDNTTNEGRVFTRNTALIGSWGVRQGVAGHYVGGTARHLSARLNRHVLLAANEKFSIVLLWRSIGHTTTNSISGLGSDSGSSGNTLLPVVYGTTDAAKLRMYLQDGSGNLPFDITSGGAVNVNNGFPHGAVGSFDLATGGAGALWIDGVADGTGTRGTISGTTTYQWIANGGIVRGGTASPATASVVIALYAVIYDTLTDAEGKALSRDPLRELTQRYLRLPAMPEVGGPTIVRPEANGSAEWTPSAGTNYQCVDEAVASDADYVYALEAGLLDSYDVPSFTDPGTNTGYIMRYRVKLAEGSAGVEARLYEGTTLISADPVQRFAAGNYEWEVDPDDMATVVDQDNLRPALFSV